MIVRQLIIIVLLVVGTVSPAGRTGAYLTSAIAQTGSGSTFSTATIEFNTLNAGGAGHTTYVSFGSGLFPSSADADMSYSVVRVKNVGTGSLTYTISTLVTDGTNNGVGSGTAPGIAAGVVLAQALQLTIKEMVSSANCTAANFTTDGGTVRYGAAALANSSATELTVIGSPTPITLAPLAETVYCFRVGLPTSADTALQNDSATIKFEFAAKQAAGT